MSYKTLKALEELHSALLNARLLKRETLGIKPEDFQRYEDAIKAILPPIDLEPVGTVTTLPDARLFDTGTRVEDASRRTGVVTYVYPPEQAVSVRWDKSNEECRVPCEKLRIIGNTVSG